MAHNPPNPDRFLRSSNLYVAMCAVAHRYDELDTPRADAALAFVEARLAEGMTPLAAVEAYESRPMAERLVGPRPRHPTTWDYGLDGSGK